MSRSLVRYVFPRFALRLTVVIAAMAIGMFVVARSYRVQAALRQLEREAMLIGLTLDQSAAAQSSDVSALLERIGDQSDLEIALYSDGFQRLYASSPGLTSEVDAAIRSATETRPGHARPGDTGRRFLAVARYVSLDHWPSVRLVVVASSLATMERNLVSLGLSLTLMVGVIFLTVLILSYRVVEAINGPLRHLQLAASRFAEGDLEYRCLLPEPREFAWLADTMNSMASQLTTRIDAIRNQRLHLEAVLGGMVEGVIVIDAQYRIRSMNAAARRLFGVDSTETTRGTPRTLLEVIRNSEIYEFVGRTLHAGAQQEATITVYSNPPRYMQVHGSMVELAEDNGVVVVLNDITRMQQLENIRRDFVANVSHELKTPITSILGFVETLAEGALDDPDEARRFLGIIGTQTQRLAAIVEDLLQLSRLEQNRGRIVVGQVSLTEIVGVVVDSLSPRAEERGIAIEVSITCDQAVTANRHLLEQALSNLVDNALKYCPRGSTVQIEAFNDRSELGIVVRDDGPGIPESDQPRIFERFYRVDRARSRSLGGTGLGLAIVKHIAQAHGGSVTLESTPGEGSTFTIRLPHTTTAHSESAAPAQLRQ